MRLAIISMILLTLIAVVSAENSCVECHKSVSAFTPEEMRFNEIRKEHLERGVSCSLECHEDLLSRLAMSNYAQWKSSKHAVSGVTCDKCHGGNPEAKDKDGAHVGVLRSSDPDSPIYYLNLPSTCGKCHEKQLSEFSLSEHYRKLERVELAPTCSTCHRPHTFDIPEATEIARICQNCHNENIGANPEVPNKAQELLKQSLELKAVVNKMKAEGKDGENVKKAEQILNAFPVTWHEFNLERLEAEIDAVKSLIGIEKETKPTPGFEAIILSIALLAALLIRRAVK
jgi:hypothetical protein